MESLIIMGSFLLESDMESLMEMFPNHNYHLLTQIKFSDWNSNIVNLSTENWLLEYDNMQFFSLFRMEKESYNKLIDVLRATDTKNILSPKYMGGHYPIGIRSQTLIFLWYMATQDSLIYIANRFKICAASVMNIINKILYFMTKLKNIYIKFPSTSSELMDVSRGFTKYPNTVGAVDGSHIFIKIEMEQQDSYIDRYKRHSINLMAICDSNKLFTYTFIGFPGSAHDARVFDNSLFCQTISREGPNSIFKNKYHIIGDSAFPLKTWLMTPYKETHELSRKEKNHNFHLSGDRVVIEHAFGMLKGRWRRLQFINTYNICKTVEIVTAACVLHNFCLLNADVLNEELFYREALPFNYVNPDRGRGEAVAKRNSIADELF